MKRTLLLIALICAALTAVESRADEAPADPKAGMKLVWADEFDYPDSQLDENWLAENGTPGHIVCSRWRENAVVKDGTLRLMNKKEKRGGKEWTSASICTKKRFQYGYFECRYRYAAATGTNNSFWLMTTAPVTGKNWYAPLDKSQHFEIDVNEGHYPSKINTNIHNWTDKYEVNGKTHHRTSHKSFVPDKSLDLSKEFHVYGLLWTEKELVFYFDGKELRREPNRCCFIAAPIFLSEAIISWAGKVTDAIDGTFMEVDYVRVYQNEGNKQ